MNRRRDPPGPRTLATTLRIAGRAMCCSVGHHAPAACAAIHARLNHFRETSFVAYDGKPVIGASLYGLDLWGEARHDRMAHRVIDGQNPVKGHGGGDMPVEAFAQLAGHLPALGTKLVLFSGGEPLLRPEVFTIADVFRSAGTHLHLLTSGILLERCADDVVRYFERVIVSLDAANEPAYHAIRGVNGLAVVERGVARLRRIAPAIPLTARATLHRLNYRALPELIEHARALALDQISFLPADLGSLAFGRTRRLDRRTQQDLQLTSDEVAEFRVLVEATIDRHKADFASGFIAESPDRLRRLPQYYAALLGEMPWPEVRCNAPWNSIVVEADGTVRPCFFHAPLGNVREESLERIVHEHLPAFRSGLDVLTNPVCQRCVCSLQTSLRSSPWS